MSSKDHPFAFEAKRLPVVLNGEEVLHLTDAVQNTDVAEGLPDKEAYVPLARDLLLLLGGAFIELVPEVGRVSAGEVTLVLTEDQVWLLRSKVSSRTKASDQTTLIGVPLLRKLYATLLKFHSDVDLETVDRDEPLPTAELIRMAKEYADATGSTDTGANPNDFTVS